MQVLKRDMQSLDEEIAQLETAMRTAAHKLGGGYT